MNTENLPKAGPILSSTIRKMGSPFLADFSGLVSLDSRDCVDESVIAALYTLEDTGNGQYSYFVKELLEERKRSIHEPIKLNKPALFRKPSPKIKSKQGKKIKALENNVSLVSCISQCRAVKGIWKNSFLMKFNPFLPHC